MRRGFTVVEVLIVIAIIFIAVALIVSSYQSQKNCVRKHLETVGENCVDRFDGTRKCEIEQKWICDEWKAEAN